MPVLKGNAGFKYDPGTGEVTVNLNWPLRNPEPADVKFRASHWSLSRKVREVVTIGSGVKEITATVRFADNPVAFLTMLDHAADGVQIDYYPDLALATSYPSELVEPTGEAIDLLRDRDFSSRGEYETELRLRRVDGGTYDALL